MLPKKKPNRISNWIGYDVFYAQRAQCFDWLFLSKPVCIRSDQMELNHTILCLLNSDQIKQTVFWSSRK